MNIYNLDVVEVPTNQPMIRVDEDDEVYRTAEEKYKAILELIDDCRTRGQPVLVGTTSIEKSELLAELLRKRGWQQRDFSNPQDLAALFKVERDEEQDLHDPERPLSRAGGLHRRAGRRAGRGDDRHQHGRPRHRHPARRQRRHARAARAGGRAGGAGARAAREGDPRRGRAAEGGGARQPAASASSAPSGTRAAASTTSCAAAPAARAIPGARSSSCRCRTT